MVSDSYPEQDLSSIPGRLLHLRLPSRSPPERLLACRARLHRLGYGPCFRCASPRAGEVSWASKRPCATIEISAPDISRAPFARHGFASRTTRISYANEDHPGQKDDATDPCRVADPRRLNPAALGACRSLAIGHDDLTASGNALGASSASSAFPPVSLPREPAFEQIGPEAPM